MAEVAERVGGREITRRITWDVNKLLLRPLEIPCRGMISPLSFDELIQPPPPFRESEDPNFPKGKRRATVLRLLRGIGGGGKEGEIEIKPDRVDVFIVVWFTRDDAARPLTKWENRRRLSVI